LVLVVALEGDWWDIFGRYDSEVPYGMVGCREIMAIDVVYDCVPKGRAAYIYSPLPGQGRKCTSFLFPVVAKVTLNFATNKPGTRSR
jgi:hypothetical protein